MLSWRRDGKMGVAQSSGGGLATAYTFAETGTSPWERGLAARLVASGHGRWVGDAWRRIAMAQQASSRVLLLTSVASHSG